MMLIAFSVVSQCMSGIRDNVYALSNDDSNRTTRIIKQAGRGRLYRSSALRRPVSSYSYAAIALREKWSKRRFSSS